SSGRGVHEALGAAETCAQEGLSVGVVDLPSIDDAMLLRLFESGQLLVFAEQNNGYIWQNFLKVLYRHRARLAAGDLNRVVTINTLASDGQAQFIHSGTYEELVDVFGLTPGGIAAAIRDRVRPGA
ncbi:MAG: transketolase C-terminal domain-containing protein, partial [Acidobacteriota bacterium]